VSVKKCACVGEYIWIHCESHLGFFHIRIQILCTNWPLCNCDLKNFHLPFYNIILWKRNNGGRIWEHSILRQCQAYSWSTVCRPCNVQWPLINTLLWRLSWTLNVCCVLCVHVYCVCVCVFLYTHMCTHTHIYSTV